MAGIEDLKKQMSQIADDEYYAGLQSLFERDPAAKEYFDTSAITYPFMEKSGEYNYKGSYARDDDVEKLKKTFEKRKFPISSESSFNEKLEKGEKPIMIYQEPVSTGSEPKDLEKISTILHEMRHKTLDTPEFQDFLMERGLKEETFVRYLDQEFFPELDAHLPNFVNPEKADKIYKEAVDDYIEMFASSTEKGFLAKLKNMFAKGGLATIFTRKR